MTQARSLDLHQRAALKIPYIQKENPQADPPGPYIFYDIKFCPFPLKWPVFAIIGKQHVLICQPPTCEDESIVILNTLCDQDDSPKTETATAPESLCSCEWNYVDSSMPLLSVAGESGLIKIFNALSGDQFTTLIGHGLGTINHLSTHPTYPWILASASMDSSVRIWDLRRCSHETQSPCIIICGHGQGHKEGILSVNWHSNGRYLLSGGFDHLVCVYTIPDLASESTFWEEIAKPRRSAESVRVIHYPHFISSAVHSDYVDCVLFYGDNILSKASQENKIVLWRINGFNSRLTPPPSEHAPKTKEYLDTRNGFLYTPPKDLDSTSSDKPLYERLLEFSIPNSELFFMRFALLQPSPTHPDLHPTLAFGNGNIPPLVLRPKSNGSPKLLLWDLQRLETGHEGTKTAANSAKYSLHDPHRPLKAHYAVSMSDFDAKRSCARGVSWSPDGKWCVIVGESGKGGMESAVAAIFERTADSDQVTPTTSRAGS